MDNQRPHLLPTPPPESDLLWLDDCLSEEQQRLDFPSSRVEGDEILIQRPAPIAVSHSDFIDIDDSVVDISSISASQPRPLSGSSSSSSDSRTDVTLFENPFLDDGHRKTYHQQQQRISDSVLIDLVLENQPNQSSSSMLDVVWNFTNSIVGAGIVGLPFAFMQSGLIPGICLLIFLASLVDWTVSTLIVVSKMTSSTTYQDLIQRCFGRIGFYLISAFQFAFAFGAMTAYTVIIGDTLPVFLRAYISNSFLTSRSCSILFGSFGVCLPLALSKNISLLSKTSAVSVLSIFFIVFAMNFTPLESNHHAAVPLLDFHFGGLTQAIGVITFAFVCHHNTLLLYGSLRKPTMDRFAYVTHASTLVSLVLCLAVALSGYLSFADQTLPNVLNNYPADSVLMNTARLAFSVNMMFTFPLDCFVARFVLERALLGPPVRDEHIAVPTSFTPEEDVSSVLHEEASPIDDRDDFGLKMNASLVRPESSSQSLLGDHSTPFMLLSTPSSPWISRLRAYCSAENFHLFSTVGLVCMTTSIALLTSNLGLVLELTGSISAVMLSFILPGACFCLLSNAKRLVWGFLPIKVLHLLTMAFGTWIMVQTCVNIYYREIHEHQALALA